VDGLCKIEDTPLIILFDCIDIAKSTAFQKRGYGPPAHRYFGQVDDELGEFIDRVLCRLLSDLSVGRFALNVLRVLQNVCR